MHAESLASIHIYIYHVVCQKSWTDPNWPTLDHLQVCFRYLICCFSETRGLKGQILHFLTAPLTLGMGGQNFWVDK